jgi:5-methylcytosine-specific restriction endonuclease McrA
MLREDRNAGFVTEGAWLWRRHSFSVGQRVAPPLTSRRLDELVRRQSEEPVCLLEDQGRRWWWFRDRFFSEADALAPEDVAALVLDRERRRRRTLERARAAMTAEQAERRREPIPREVRRVVWERDGGRCVTCGADFDLQYDHVIPHALGGAGTEANLQLLCGDCNRAKGAGL